MRVAAPVSCLDGTRHLVTREIARSTGQWRNRYEERGLAGPDDRERSGRPRVLDHRAIVAKTLMPPLLRRHCPESTPAPSSVCHSDGVQQVTSGEPHEPRRHRIIVEGPVEVRQQAERNWFRESGPVALGLAGVAVAIVTTVMTHLDYSSQRAAQHNEDLLDARRLAYSNYAADLAEGEELMWKYSAIPGAKGPSRDTLTAKFWSEASTMQGKLAADEYRLQVLGAHYNPKIKTERADVYLRFKCEIGVQVCQKISTEPVAEVQRDLLDGTSTLGAMLQRWVADAQSDVGSPQ